MPYIERDKDTNKVKGVYRQLQKGYAEEFLPDDNAEVLAYLNPVPLSDADSAEGEIKRQKPLLGLVRVLAKRFNLTEQQVINQIKAEL